MAPPGEDSTLARSRSVCATQAWQGSDHSTDHKHMVTHDQSSLHASLLPANWLAASTHCPVHQSPNARSRGDVSDTPVRKLV